MLLGLRTAIYPVDDMEKAKAWYAKAFGIRPYFDQPFYVGYDVGGYELGLVPREGATRGSVPVAYWGVANIAAAHAKLLGDGATAVEAPHDVGGDIVVGSVKDPFGNVLGLIQNPHFKPA